MSTMRKKKPTPIGNVLGGAKKTAAKKVTAKKKGNGTAPALMAAEGKRVSIEKAGNGYTVSTYDMDGGKSMVAKSMKECMSHVKGMMGE